MHCTAMPCHDLKNKCKFVFMCLQSALSPGMGKNASAFAIINASLNMH
jgi:Zn-finger protein